MEGLIIFNLNGIDRCCLSKTQPQFTLHDQQSMYWDDDWEGGIFQAILVDAPPIGTSEMYESTASRDNGIESVKKNAPDATVDDQTV